MTCNGIPIKLPADFSAQTAGQENVHDVLKSDEREKPTTRIPYSARVSFRFDGEIKSFTDKQELRKSSTTKPAL